MVVTCVSACQGMPGSEGRITGKDSELGASSFIQGLKQNLPHGTVSPAVSPAPSDPV